MNTTQLHQSLHEFLSSFPPELTLWFPLLAIGLGVAMCFFGWRIFKVVLGISGFLTGALLVGTFVFSLSDSYLATLIAALFAGLISAAMLVMLYLLGVFFFGAAMGVLIGYLGFMLAGEVYWISVLMLLGLIGGIAALVYQRLMIVISTAVIGATGTVLGGLWYSTQGWVSFNALELDAIAQHYAIVSIIAGAVLSAAGIFVQYWLKTGVRTVASAAPGASAEPAAGKDVDPSDQKSN